MKILTALGVVLTLGCGATGPDLVNISGNWNFTGDWHFSGIIGEGTIDERARSVWCDRVGSLRITQNDANFSGTLNATSGSCIFSTGGVTDNTGTEPFGGAIDGNLITFETQICKLRGVYREARPIAWSEA